MTDEITRFDELKTVYLKNGDYKEIQIQTCRYSKDFVFLKLKGYETFEAVEPLRNQELWIPRYMAKILPEDTYFITDLLDCQVETFTGEILGRITEVIETGSNDVYIVEGGSKGQILIPALKKVVTKVDLSNKRVIVDLTDMEGLLPNED